MYSRHIIRRGRSVRLLALLLCLSLLPVGLLACQPTPPPSEDTTAGESSTPTEGDTSVPADPADTDPSATDQICVYPINFVPGQDASIYWARFEGYPGATATVVAGSTFKLTDIPGDNRGNWQVGHMYDPLPAGEYKAVIRGADGSVVLQVNFTVEEP